METAEFEEKEYEIPLYNELLNNSSGNLWPSGQVFEHHFGIDAALQVNNPLFWSIVGVSSPPKGATLNNHRWGRIWRDIARKSDQPLRSSGRRLLPNFNTNLLMQIKRPDYLKGSNSRLSPYGISAAYWRFKTLSHQQDALEYISRKLSTRVFVAYGCAAFHTRIELYGHIVANTLIVNSSFVRAQRLSGHKAWTYNQPGMVGVACSEKEHVQEPSLLDQIEKFIRGTEKVDSTKKERTERTLGNLNKLSHVLIDAMKESSQGKNPIALEFIRRFEIGMEELRSGELRPEVKAFSIIAGLFEFIGTSWLVAG